MAGTELNEGPVGELVPVIVQDAGDGRVLMLAWMDDEALRRTRETGEAWFWSRSRQEYWHKGATSGSTLAVEEIRDDCDGDTLLLRARPAGPVCHTGAESASPRGCGAGSSSAARSAPGLIRRRTCSTAALRRRRARSGKRASRPRSRVPANRTSGSSRSSPISGSTVTSCCRPGPGPRARRGRAAPPPALTPVAPLLRSSAPWPG